MQYKWPEIQSRFESYYKHSYSRPQDTERQWNWFFFLQPIKLPSVNKVHNDKLKSEITEEVIAKTNKSPDSDYPLSGYKTFKKRHIPVQFKTFGWVMESG